MNFQRLLKQLNEEITYLTANIMARGTGDCCMERVLLTKGTEVSGTDEDGDAD